MAFTKGKQVKHGVTGQTASTEKSPAAAKKRVKALHKENKPEQKNRGQQAKKRHKAREKKKK